MPRRNRWISSSDGEGSSTDSAAEDENRDLAGRRFVDAVASTSEEIATALSRPSAETDDEPNDDTAAWLMFAATNQNSIPWLQFLLMSQAQSNITWGQQQQAPSSSTPKHQQTSIGLSCSATTSNFAEDAQPVDMLRLLFDQEKLLERISRIPTLQPEVSLQGHLTALAYYLSVREERGVEFVGRVQLVELLEERRLPMNQLHSLLALIDEWGDGDKIHVQHALLMLKSFEVQPLPVNFATCPSFRSGHLAKSRLLPSEFHYLSDSNGPEDYGRRLTTVLKATQLPPSKFRPPGCARLGREYTKRKAVLWYWMVLQRRQNGLFHSEDDNDNDTNTSSLTNSHSIDCIDRLVPSSNPQAVNRLLDGLFASTSEGQHSILIGVRQRLIPKCLELTVNPSDASYMPKTIRILSGNRRRRLHFIKNIPRSTNGAYRIPLDISSPVRYIQLTIVDCYEGGFDTRIRGLRLTGVPVPDPLSNPANGYLQEMMDARRLESSWLISAQLMQMKQEDYATVISFTMESFGRMKPLSMMHGSQYSDGILQLAFTSEQREQLRWICYEVLLNCSNPENVRANALICLIRMAYAEASIQVFVDLLNFILNHPEEMESVNVDSEFDVIKVELNDRLEQLLHRLDRCEARRLPVIVSQQQSDKDMVEWTIRLESGQPFLCTSIELVSTSPMASNTSNTGLIEAVNHEPRFWHCVFKKDGRSRYSVHGQLAGESFSFRTRCGYGIVANGIQVKFSSLPIDQTYRTMDSRLNMVLKNLLADTVAIQRLTTQLRISSCRTTLFSERQLAAVFQFCQRNITRISDPELTKNGFELLNGALVDCNNTELSEKILDWLLQLPEDSVPRLKPLAGQIISDACEYLFGTAGRKRELFLDCLTAHNVKVDQKFSTFDDSLGTSLYSAPLLEALCRHYLSKNNGRRHGLIKWLNLNQITELLDLGLHLEINETASIFRALIGDFSRAGSIIGDLLTTQLFELILWLQIVMETATGIRKLEIQKFAQKMAATILEEILSALHQYFTVHHPTRTRLIDTIELNWLNPLMTLLDVLVDSLLPSALTDQVQLLDDLHFAVKKLLERLKLCAFWEDEMNERSVKTENVKLCDWPIAITEAAVSNEQKRMDWQFRCPSADSFGLKFDGSVCRLRLTDQLKIRDHYGNVITMDEHAIMTAIEHQQRDAEHQIFFDSPSSLFISFVRKNQDNGFAIVGLPSSSLFGFTITAYGHKKGSADESPMETFLFMTIRMSSHLLANLANALKNVDVSELLNDNLSKFIDAGMPEEIDVKTSPLNDAECQLRQNLEQLIRKPDSAAKTSSILQICSKLFPKPLLLNQSTAISRRSLAVFVAIVWNLVEVRAAAIMALEETALEANKTFDQHKGALLEAYRRAVQCSHQQTARRQQIARESNGVEQWAGSDFEEPLDDMVTVLLREIPAPLSIGCGGNSVADDLERLAMTVTVDWRKLRTVCENSRLRIQLSSQLADTITAVLVPEPEPLTDSEIDWPKALKFKFLSIFCEHFHGTGNQAADEQLFQTVQSAALGISKAEDDQRFGAVCALFMASRLNRISGLRYSFMRNLLSLAEKKTTIFEKIPLSPDLRTEIDEIYHLAAEVLKNPTVFFTMGQHGRQIVINRQRRRGAEADITPSLEEFFDSETEQPSVKPIAPSNDEVGPRRLANVQLAYGRRLGFPAREFRCAVCVKNLDLSVNIYRCLECPDMSICCQCFDRSSVPNCCPPHRIGHALLLINYSCNRCDGLILGSRWSRNRNEQLTIGEDEEYDICMGCRQLADFPASTASLHLKDNEAERLRNESLVEFSPHIFVQNGDPGRMNLAKYLRALMPFVLTANLEAKKQFNGEEQDLVGLVGHLLERLNSLNKSNGDLIGLLYRYVNTKNGYMQFLRILYNLLNQGALSLSDEFGLLSVFIRTIGRAVRTEILNYADIDRLFSPIDLDDSAGLQLMSYLFGFAKQCNDFGKSSTASCICRLLHSQLLDSEQFRRICEAYLREKINEAEGEDYDFAVLLALGWPIGLFPGAPAEFKSPQNVSKLCNFLAINPGSKKILVLDTNGRPHILWPDKVECPIIGPSELLWKTSIGNLNKKIFPTFMDKRFFEVDRMINGDELIRMSNCAAKSTGYSTGCTIKIFEWAYQCLLTTGKDKMGHLLTKISNSTGNKTENMTTSTMIFEPKDLDMFDFEISKKPFVGSATDAIELDAYRSLLGLVLTRGYIIDRGALDESIMSDEYVSPLEQKISIEQFVSNGGNTTTVDTIDQWPPYSLVHENCPSPVKFDRTAVIVLLYETTLLFRAGIPYGEIYGQVRRRLEAVLEILYCRRFLANLLLRLEKVDRLLFDDNDKPLLSVGRILRLIDMLGMNLDTRNMVGDILERIVDVYICKGHGKELLDQAFELLRLAAPKIAAFCKNSENDDNRLNFLKVEKFNAEMKTIENLRYAEAAQMSKIPLNKHLLSEVGFHFSSNLYNGNSLIHWYNEWLTDRHLKLKEPGGPNEWIYVRYKILGGFDAGIAIVDQFLQLTSTVPGLMEIVARPEIWSGLAAIVERTILHGHDQRRILQLFNCHAELTRLIRLPQRVNLVDIEKLWHFADEIMDKRQKLHESRLTPAICQVLVQWMAAVNLMVKRCEMQREVITVLSPTSDECRQILVHFTQTLRKVLNAQAVIEGRPLLPEPIVRTSNRFPSLESDDFPGEMGLTTDSDETETQPDSFVGSVQSDEDEDEDNWNSANEG